MSTVVPGRGLGWGPGGAGAVRAGVRAWPRAGAGAAAGNFRVSTLAPRGVWVAIIAASIETRVSTVFLTIPENKELSIGNVYAEHTSVDSRGARR